MNQTEAFSTAARGSGLANGFCHMLPWPEKWVANSWASASIDCSLSHVTYSALPPYERPLRPPISRGNSPQPGAGPQPLGPGRVELLVVADLAGLVVRLWEVLAVGVDVVAH